jgi:hypothetical protein
MTVSATSYAKDGFSSIISPSASNPAEIEQNEVLEVLVLTRLPLTPPPGVQQPAAHQGWHILLKQNDVYTLHGKNKSLEYEVDVIRLRPSTNSNTYLLHARPLPWIPNGSYDLDVQGPGFKGFAPRAIQIGVARENQPKTTGIRVEHGSDTLDLINPNPGDTKFEFNLLVPAAVGGIELSDGSRVLKPSRVVWAGVKSQKISPDRLLTYKVLIPGTGTDGKPGHKQVRWRRLKPLTCRAEISISEDKLDYQTLSWREFELRLNEFDALNIIWDFGGGYWGVGKKFRHRFLLEQKATVRATAFDIFGRTCSAEKVVALALKRSKASTSCNALPVGCKHSSIKAFFLLARILWE